MALTADDRYLILTASQKIEIIDWKTKQKIAAFEDPDHSFFVLINRSHLIDQLKYIVPTADNSTFIASDEDENIKIFDIKTKQAIHQFKNPEGSIFYS